MNIEKVFINTYFLFIDANIIFFSLATLNTALGT